MFFFEACNGQNQKWLREHPRQPSAVCCRLGVPPVDDNGAMFSAHWVPGDREGLVSWTGPCCLTTGSSRYNVDIHNADTRNKIIPSRHIQKSNLFLGCTHYIYQKTPYLCACTSHLVTENHASTLGRLNNRSANARLCSMRLCPMMPSWSCLCAPVQSMWLAMVVHQDLWMGLRLKQGERTALAVKQRNWKNTMVRNLDVGVAAGTIRYI